jgi:DNA-binding transcriptional MerR regulator
MILFSFGTTALDMAESEAPRSAEYTIDELSALSHLPSRTIRFYQSRGALMAPNIRGRVAYYGEPHMERLKLIAQLQDRGLSIDAIRDLVQSIGRGELDLAEWLGVEQQMQASWSHDQPRTVSEQELLELLGEVRPGFIAELTRGKLLERRGDVYLIQSPALLQIAVKLAGAGIDLETCAGAAEILRKHLSHAVHDLVQLFFKRAREGGSASDPQLLEALRPLGSEAVRLIFAHEMERSLRKVVESGELAKLQRDKKKKKR